MKRQYKCFDCKKEFEREQQTKPNRYLIGFICPECLGHCDLNEVEK